MQGELIPTSLEGSEAQNQEEQQQILYDFSDCRRIKKLTTHEYQFGYLVFTASDTKI